MAEREDDLIKLQLLLHDKAFPHLWQAGWHKQRQIPGLGSPSQAEVDTFVTAHNTLKA